MSISVIIPAYDEERYLGETLHSVQRAKGLLLEMRGVATEIIVVDNGSIDATASIARAAGAQVIEESEHNVARVRNTGAATASGQVLVFIDADVTVPESLLWRIDEVMADEACLGGAVDTIYQPAKHSVKIYLRMWRLLGKLMGMAQGATQFCRRDVLVSLEGYDETLFMGEAVDFYWRMKRLAKRGRARVCFMGDVQVSPSTRRFDRWSFWRIVIWTNPLFIFLFRRRKRVWREWYSVVPR